MLFALLVLGWNVPTIAGPEDEFKLAVAHYKAKRHQSAAEAFERYLVSAPNDATNRPTARFFLGLSEVGLEKYEPARKTFREFLNENPKHEYVADARYQVAWCSYLLGEREAAIRDFVSFLNNHEKHPNAEWALVYLGDAQLQLERAEDAAKSFRRSLAEFPKGAMAEDARMGLARTYELQKDFENAITEYRTVADDPRAGRREEARFALAGRLYDLKQYEESAKEYDAFATQFGDGKLAPSARLNAGYAYFEMKDYDRAIARFDAAAESPESAGTARYWSALASREQGQYDNAARKFAAAFEASEKSPEAPAILYQWADAEFLLGRFEKAAELFARVSENWPEDEIADEALHEAGNAALRSGDVNAAIQHVSTFAKRYGTEGPLAFRQQMLIGRIELARGKPDDLTNAEKRLRIVVEKAEKLEDEEATLEHARYELGRARFRLEDYTGVNEALAPLLETLKKTGGPSPYIEAFVLQSTAQLELENYEAADEAAADYLAVEPNDTQSARATANRALARAHLGMQEAAAEQLASLDRLDTETDLPLRTRFAIAEIAYDDGEFAAARDAYSKVLEAAGDGSVAPLALTGLGWSEYELRNYDEAAKQFAAFVERYGDDPKLGPESHYMVGKALEDAGKPKEAAAAFAKCFGKYAPTTPAGPGADRSGSTMYAYKAGLQHARALAGDGDVARADAAYEKVASTFPEAAGADLLLDEWALLNYEAGKNDPERYARSDELFQRLVKNHPKSERVDDARFHLAESAHIDGRSEEAEREFTALVESDTADPYIREHATHHLLEIAVANRDWRAVAERADAFLKEYADSEYAPLATFRRGEASLNLGRLTEANIDLRNVLEKDTDSAREPWYDRVRVLLAESAFRAKDYEEVETQVARMRAESPESPFLYQADEVLGRSFKQRPGPKLDLARAAFSRVVNDEHGAKTETAAKAQFLLAETYLLENPKEYERARDEFVKVHVLYAYPEWRSVGLFQAARCDEALRDTDAAKRSYATLVEKFPKSEYADEAKARLRALGGSN